jgi:hypothetical protein
MLSSVITTFIRNYKGISFLLRKKIYISEVYKEIWRVGGRVPTATSSASRRQKCKDKTVGFGVPLNSSL